MSVNKVGFDKGFLVYIIPAYELELIAEFHQKHKGRCNPNGIGVYYTHSSGIGTNIVATCPVCEEECDVTDYGSW